MTETQEKEIVAAIEKMLELARALDRYDAAELEAVKMVYRAMLNGRKYLTQSEENTLIDAYVETGWKGGLIVDYLDFQHACRRRDALEAAYGVEEFND